MDAGGVGPPASAQDGDFGRIGDGIEPAEVTAFDEAGQRGAKRPERRALAGAVAGVEFAQRQPAVPGAGVQYGSACRD